MAGPAAERSRPRRGGWFRCLEQRGAQGVTIDDDPVYSPALQGWVGALWARFKPWGRLTRELKT